MARLRNSQIGFVFQDSLLIPSLSVLENAALPLVYAGVVPRERHRRALGLLEELGLGDRLDHRPSALSGGERQRTAIARALINDPSLILADEPTGNLDQDNGRRIMGILDGLHRRGKTVMVVTHDPEIARHGERTITIVDGRIVSTASSRAGDGE
jgi:putative ABC transport system ATP-binding protein